MAEKKTTTTKIDKAEKAESDAQAMHGIEPIKPPTAQEAKEIKIIERIIENKEIAPTDAFGKLNRSQIDLIKRTVAKGATDDELKMFIQVCKGANLNPFLKQVHLIPRWDSKEGKDVRTIQVSIDGFRAIAESSGAYAGNDDAIFEGEEDMEYTTKTGKHKVTVPKTAKVTVYKIVDGNRYGFTATARWSEYYPGEKMGFQWHIRPYLMLGKCAEALALRKAFPKLLSGMYASEEMDRGQSEAPEGAKIEAGFKKLISMVQTAKLPELVDYRAKIEKSEKYTPAQKKEFIDLADKRIAELRELDKIAEEVN